MTVICESPLLAIIRLWWLAFVHVVLTLRLCLVMSTYLRQLSPLECTTFSLRPCSIYLCIMQMLLPMPCLHAYAATLPIDWHNECFTGIAEESITTMPVLFLSNTCTSFPAKTRGGHLSSNKHRGVSPTLGDRVYYMHQSRCML